MPWKYEQLPDLQERMRKKFYNVTTLIKQQLIDQPSVSHHNAQASMFILGVGKEKIDTLIHPAALTATRSNFTVDIQRSFEPNFLTTSATRLSCVFSN